MNMISQAIKDQIELLLGSPVTDASPESGGSINRAWKIGLADGRDLFLKTNSGDLLGMFRTEARGLNLLREACDGEGVIHVPEAIATDLTPDGQQSWLLMEYIGSSRTAGDFFVRFGRALAALHRHSAPVYGLDHHNYIGRLFQSNTPHATWASFYANERLLPQMRDAIDAGLLQAGISGNFERLCARLGEIFPDEPPALLHGDLWGGNYLCDSRGNPVIIDPAVYYGHREMEIAFTRLFGGYDREFYTSYNEALPLAPGHGGRVDVCNLYPLLVHTNLFGSSYAGQVTAIVKRF
jgi:protein-ribulosamine 3-kinase